jgi:uncharacterized protein
MLLFKSTHHMITTLALVFVIIIAASAMAQDDLILGKKITMKSEVLGEDRMLFISTPANYDGGTERYPVLYVLDGENNFQFSAVVANYLANVNIASPLIVVGIPNTDRNRDFTPTVDSKRGGITGGADAFLKFTKTELIPFIDSQYRTHPYRILVGHSLCGMFSIYALISEPELFQAHIAISPALMYDNQVVVNKAKNILQTDQSFSQTLYITLGNEPDYTKTLAEFTDLLKDKARKLHWEYHIMKSENHGSIPLKSVYDGLSFIYGDWSIPDVVVDKGMSEVESYYAALSKKYGYQLSPTEFLINNHGYRLLGREKLNAALSLFQWNVKTYPNSANVYDSLGEALEQAKQFDEALKNYQLAVEKADALNDRNLAVFKQHVDRVKQKMGNTM